MGNRRTDSHLIKISLTLPNLLVHPEIVTSVTSQQPICRQLFYIDLYTTRVSLVYLKICQFFCNRDVCPISVLAREYSAQQQQQGTGTNDEPTPITRRVHGYHPGFPASRLCFPPPSVQSCQRRSAVARAVHAPPALAPPS